jgi:hypothetical protein
LHRWHVHLASWRRGSAGLDAQGPRDAVWGCQHGRLVHGGRLCRALSLDISHPSVAGASAAATQPCRGRQHAWPGSQQQTTPRSRATAWAAKPLTHLLSNALPPPLDLKLLHQIETLANSRGLVALSPSADAVVLACPGLHTGQVGGDAGRGCVLEAVAGRRLWESAGCVSPPDLSRSCSRCGRRKSAGALSHRFARASTRAPRRRI